MAARGFATISITNFGNGYGAATTMLVTDKTGSVTSVPRPGRGLDIDGNGTIDAYEGCLIVAGSQVVGMRDCIRQTALDNMQLIRAIQAGIDLTGDGTVDLSRNLIFYVGYSFGGSVGSVLNAVEPAIQSVVLNCAGGTMVEAAAWSPINHLVVLAMLAYRQPVLINRPGPDFNAALTLRNQPVRIIDVPGAIAIQELLERVEWNNMLGDALSFAPHLSWSPLPGVSAKPVLFQFAWGDLTLPNPTESAVVRAANTPGLVSLFRTDMAWLPNMRLSADPHDFGFDFYTSAASVVVARATQTQMAMFLSGDGRSVPYVNNLLCPPYLGDLFFVPKVLPEDLNF
jgi:pimeloyl-ACP methyl ester carboxylesterase